MYPSVDTVVCGAGATFGEPEDVSSFELPRMNSLERSIPAKSSLGDLRVWRLLV